MEVSQQLRFVRSALYVPASNARALEKARGLEVDMLIIDLEDAVTDENKDDARLAAIDFVATGVSGKIMAIRANGIENRHHAADMKAIAASNANLVVLPKVERTDDITDCGKAVLAMIETPTGIYAAREIAAHSVVAGLIAGTNDIAAETGIRPGPNREGLELALQAIVLAAAASHKPRFDGVCNRLDDMVGFDAECRQGATYGFTGKTLIHPNQIMIANQIFGPDAAAVAEAKELIAANRGGAQRFKGRMIESMHVEEAKLTVERSRHAMG
ncbi:HpcH/HpaI aldolase/citrate lyase family protein [Sphingorhabdus sp.]|uniref:HpcH/HpaI aldolase/citrate lyase family protein n=1 Tax=Sphingorhabdus sp. TaxID=1902408 RepID=UPI00391C02FB